MYVCIYVNYKIIYSFVHQKLLVSSSKDVEMANDLSLQRNVTIHKKKRKTISYVEIVKEKISERKGENPKTLVIEYKKNNEKQENLEYTQKRKAQKTLD